MTFSPRYRALVYASLLASFLVVVWGGIVRVTGSGLGCPDWPLCHGQFLPSLDPATRIEWTHRFLAIVSGLTVAATVLWTLISYRVDRRVLWLAIAGAKRKLDVARGRRRRRNVRPPRERRVRARRERDHSVSRLAVVWRAAHWCRSTDDGQVLHTADRLPNDGGARDRDASPVHRRRRRNHRCPCLHRGVASPAGRAWTWSACDRDRRDFHRPDRDRGREPAD